MDCCRRTQGRGLDAGEGGEGCGVCERYVDVVCMSVRECGMCGCEGHVSS